MAATRPRIQAPAVPLAPPHPRLPRRNIYRDAAASTVLSQAEAWLWDLQEIDADLARDPDSWDFPEESRRFALFHVEQANEELERREGLRHRPGAPAWPDRWPDRRADVEQVKRTVDLADFIERMSPGTTFWRHGAQLSTRCMLPGHDDGSPSFYVHPDKGLWYCHGCHRGGDIISWAQHYLGTDDFPSVVELLKGYGEGAGRAVRGG